MGPTQMKTVRWDGRFLQLAALVAGWSKDPSTKCGAAIIRPNKTIASIGFNGFPQAISDDMTLLEDREEKYKRVIHAEMNALLFLREPALGYTLYTWPFLTCERCAVHVIQSGIRRVVSLEPEPSEAWRWIVAHQTARSLYREAEVDILEIEQSSMEITKP